MVTSLCMMGVMKDNANLQTSFLESGYEIEFLQCEWMAVNTRLYEILPGYETYYDNLLSNAQEYNNRSKLFIVWSA